MFTDLFPAVTICKVHKGRVFGSVVQLSGEAGCGILVEWVSNTKEIPIYPAKYAERGYTEDLSKSREMMAGFFAVLHVMAKHAGKKFLV